MTQLTPGPRWNKLETALDINDSGSIVGVCQTVGGVDHAFLGDEIGGYADLDPSQCQLVCWYWEEYV